MVYKDWKTFGASLSIANLLMNRAVQGCSFQLPMIVEKVTKSVNLRFYNRNNTHKCEKTNGVKMNWYFHLEWFKYNRNCIYIGAQLCIINVPTRWVCLPDNSDNTSTNAVLIRALWYQHYRLVSTATVKGVGFLKHRGFISKRVDIEIKIKSKFQYT